MPAFTSFLNLYKPGGGSTGLILPDEVVDIDRINANMDVIDTFASGWGQAANRSHQFYGPAAALSGITGMKRGDTYQESDGQFQLWKYNGAWILYASAEVAVTYSTGWSTDSQAGTFRIANGMVNFTGRVKATAGSGGDVMFVLPSEARPLSQQVKSVWAGPGGLLDLIIDTNGNVTQFGRGSSARADVRLATITPYPVASL